MCCLGLKKWNNFCHLDAKFGPSGWDIFVLFNAIHGGEIVKYVKSKKNTPYGVIKRKSQERSQGGATLGHMEAWG